MSGRKALGRFIVFLIATGLLASVASPARASSDFYGVVPQAFPTATDLGLMKSGGVGSVRMTISSDSVSPSKGVMNWGVLDQAVYLASSAGLSVLPTFYGSPPWIDSDFRAMPDDAESIAQWDRMLTEAVRRYGNGGTFWQENPAVPSHPIETWQIWNEPNAKWFVIPPISPRTYANLLIESSKTIRSLDSQAKIMTAGLFPMPDPDDGIPASRYLTRLYAVDGFKQSFDFLAVHPYASDTQTSVSRLRDLRTTMKQAGDGDKGMYITEIGWGSDSLTGLGMDSEAGQAARLTEFYDALLAARTSLKLRGVYWFAMRDAPTGTKTCSFCYGTGLLDQYGNPKLAWSALTNVIRSESVPQATGVDTASSPCVAPDLVSMKLPAARRKLARTNCRILVAKKSWRSPTRAAVGRVEKQSPKPMTVWPAKTKVQVVVPVKNMALKRKKRLGVFMKGHVDAGGLRPSP